ncbi:MAG: hypothetical protein K0S63_1227 [Gammaproteobacteria bacterium]|nr:hypothetical protein [Gammaproteobacteria bacterium]
MFSYTYSGPPLLAYKENKNELLIKQHKKWLQTTKKLPTDESYLITTERPHHLTRTLSQDAQHNLPKAIDNLKEVDLLALKKLASDMEEKFFLFKQEAELSLNEGHKIFISGCGAAGRAATLIAGIIARQFPHRAEQFIPIMAGGDASVVKASEGFEDNAEYGKKQLIDMGWAPSDLLIVLSASGSASFIHGQLEYAVENGKRNPFFFYCNTHEEVRTAFSERNIFKEEKLHNSIHFVSTVVGEMGLSGSTRMQAATAQTLLALPLMDILASLDEKKSYDNTVYFFKALSSILRSIDLHVLKDFIRKEADIYGKAGDVIYYIAQPLYAQNILTDTTERAPTFTLNYFENELDDVKLKREKPSKVRLLVEGAKNSREAWINMLGRPPFALNWPEVPTTSLERIYGFDLSENIILSRSTYTPTIHSHYFHIKEDNNQFFLKLDDLTASFDLKAIDQLPPYLQGLVKQCFLKIILNIHSTLVMGVRDFYYSNQMAYVRPSNLKLINRSASGIHRMLHDPAGPTGKKFPLSICFFRELSHYPDFVALLMYSIVDKLYKEMLEEDAQKTKPGSRSIVCRVSNLFAETAHRRLENQMLQQAIEMDKKIQSLEFVEEKMEGAQKARI